MTKSNPPSPPWLCDNCSKISLDQDRRCSRCGFVRCTLRSTYSPFAEATPSELRAREAVRQGRKRNQFGDGR